jgi:hypothetical protein
MGLAADERTAASLPVVKTRNDGLLRLLPAAMEVAAVSTDPQAVELARAVVGLAGEREQRPAAFRDRERMTAATASGSVPACPACGRLFAAAERGIVPEHGPVGDRCAGSRARVVWV